MLQLTGSRTGWHDFRAVCEQSRRVLVAHQRWIDWKQFKADIGSGLPDDGKLEPRHATCYFVGADATARSLIIIAGTGGTSPNAANAATLNSIRRLPLPEAALLP